ncbi:MAG: hypothetical protein QXO98_05270 [Sulfolobales archaeon]
MSLAVIEEEARRIIKEAEKRAEEIILKARKEAEDILKKEVSVELPEDLVRKLEEEFQHKISTAREYHNIKVSRIREIYSRLKGEIVDDYMRLVLGL